MLVLFRSAKFPPLNLKFGERFKRKVEALSATSCLF